MPLFCVHFRNGLADNVKTAWDSSLTLPTFRSTYLKRNSFFLRYTYQQNRYPTSFKHYFNSIHNIFKTFHNVPPALKDEVVRLSDLSPPSIYLMLQPRKWFVAGKWHCCLFAVYVNIWTNLEIHTQSRLLSTMLNCNSVSQKLRLNKR